MRRVLGPVLWIACSSPLGCGFSLACGEDGDCPSGETCGAGGVCGAGFGGDAGASADAGIVGDADAGATEDAGSGDAGSGDAGSGDAGSGDAGSGDAGSGDAGAVDAGSPVDAGSVDAGSPVDAGAVDAGGAGAVCGDGSVEPGEACDDGNLVDRDGCSSACRVWWDEAFSVRVRVDLASPAAQDLASVPVALSVPAALLPADVGAACVVAPDQKTVLPVEIERPAAGAAPLLLWTRTALPSGTSSVFVYPGSDPACSGTAAAVWSGYAGVWHMEDRADSVAGVALQNESNGPAPTAAGARGAAFDVSASGWPKVEPPGDLWIDGSVTVEAWGRLSAFGSAADWENTLFQAAGGNRDQAYFLNVENDGRLRAYWETSAGAYDQKSTSSFSLAPGDWHHYAMVRDGAARTVRFFVDGAQLGSAVSFSRAPADSPASTSFLYLGGNFTATSRRFTGTLDEVHIAASALSAAEIAVSHAATAGTLVVGTVREP